MRRDQLEHLIRAAGAITNEYEFVVIGSQSILGAFPHAPAELLESMEADLYPLQRPELADLIDGAIGEMSTFNEHFGYYAQGVGPETAILPEGWRDRLLRVQGPSTDLRIGWCLEPHDLAAAKLAAGREKDKTFVLGMLRHGMIDPAELCSRLDDMPISEQRAQILRLWVGLAVATAQGPQDRDAMAPPSGAPEGDR